MKTAVATHEASHLCAILKTPIRECILEARIFQGADGWRGDCRVDSKCLPGIDKNGVYDFAKNIAGPIGQIQLFPDTIPIAIAEAIKIRGGLLSGYWWIYNNLPDTKVNWHSDMATWLKWRKFTPPEFDLHGFYETEKQMWSWIGNPLTRSGIQEIADRLIANEQLGRNQLLEINLNDVPIPVLPSSL